VILIVGVASLPVIMLILAYVQFRLYPQWSLMFAINSRWPIGFLVWLLLSNMGLFFLKIRWHAQNIAYMCPNCNHVFMIH
jgi:hypothetical protein